MTCDDIFADGFTCLKNYLIALKALEMWIETYKSEAVCAHNFCSNSEVKALRRHQSWPIKNLLLQLKTNLSESVKRRTREREISYLLFFIVIFFTLAACLNVKLAFWTLVSGVEWRLVGYFFGCEKIRCSQMWLITNDENFKNKENSENLLN